MSRSKTQLRFADFIIELEELRDKYPEFVFTGDEEGDVAIHDEFDENRRVTCNCFIPRRHSKDPNDYHCHFSK